MSSGRVGSASLRVLAVRELLELIFSFADEKSNASNACVCKGWSEPALDILWREVKDLARLLRVLAPLKVAKEIQGIPVYEFARNPEPKDWARFTPYARRVHSLHVDFGPAKLMGSVYDVLARTRTTLHILPNLRSFTWIASLYDALDHSIVFMHDRIKNFAVRFPVTKPTRLLQYFENVQARMPSLERLDLRVHLTLNDVSVIFVEAHIVSLLSSLKSLKTIIFPANWITACVVECLSTLPSLRIIQFEYFDHQGRGDPQDVKVFRPKLRPGAFPSLADLSLSAGLTDMAMFITSPNAPTSTLTSLYVDSPNVIESPADVHYFLTIVSENCKRVEELFLNLLEPSFEHEQGSTSERLSLSTISPIFGISQQLKRFEIAHNQPLLLTQMDVETLAKNLPLIETLMLNEEPSHAVLVDDPDPPELTLRALLPFAKYCPRLRYLGIYILGTEADLPDARSGNRKREPAHSASDMLMAGFENLITFSLGASPIASPGPIAIFLSEWVPEICTIQFGVTWDLNMASESQLSAMKARCDKWKEVVGLLPLLTKARRDDRRQKSELTRRIKDLEMRNGVLMESVSIGMVKGKDKVDSGCVAM